MGGSSQSFKSFATLMMSTDSRRSSNGSNIYVVPEPEVETSAVLPQLSVVGRQEPSSSLATVTLLSFPTESPVDLLASAEIPVLYSESPRRISQDNLADHLTRDLCQSYSLKPPTTKCCGSPRDEERSSFLEDAVPMWGGEDQSGLEDHPMFQQFDEDAADRPSPRVRVISCATDSSQLSMDELVLQRKNSSVDLEAGLYPFENQRNGKSSCADKLARIPRVAAVIIGILFIMLLVLSVLAIWSVQGPVNLSNELPSVTPMEAIQRRLVAILVPSPATHSN